MMFVISPLSFPLSLLSFPFLSFPISFLFIFPSLLSSFMLLSLSPLLPSLCSSILLFPPPLPQGRSILHEVSNHSVGEKIKKGAKGVQKDRERLINGIFSFY